MALIYQLWQLNLCSSIPYLCRTTSLMPSLWMEVTSTQQAKTTAWSLLLARATQVKSQRLTRTMIQSHIHVSKNTDADMFFSLQLTVMAPHTMRLL